MDNSPSPQPLALAAPARHLRQLLLIRSLVLIFLTAGTLTTLGLDAVSLPYPAVLGLLLGYGALNILSYLRLKRSTLPVTELEVFIQLLFDVVLLSVLFYTTGGANNPFIFYFLVPISICAATLPWGYTWALAGLSLASYTLLLFFHIPLPAISPGHHAHAHAPLNLHVLGMWLNFFISAALITYFVVRMARDLRRQEDQLNQQREDQLRGEQLMAVATLAAGTAHELGTPLNTLKILLAEMREEHGGQNHDSPQLLEDLRTLSEQVELCSDTLRHLVASAERSGDDFLPPQSLKTFCRQLIDRWQLMRPDVTLTLDIAGNDDGPSVAFPPTIAQSITNLLNNAADAEPRDIDIRIRWWERELRWRITDRGPGIDLDIAEQLGKPFITGKDGLGLGLFLSHATVNRYGGKVHLYNEKAGGTRTEFRLPLEPFIRDQ